MNFLRSFLACFLLVVVVPVAGLYAADDDIPEDDGTQNCQNGQYYWDRENSAWASGGLKDGQVCLAFPMKFEYSGSGCLPNSTENGEIEVDLKKGALSIENEGWLEISDNKCYYSDISYSGQPVNRETSQVQVEELGDVIKGWTSDPESKVLEVVGRSKNYVVSYYLNDTETTIDGLTTTCTFYEDCKLKTMDEVKKQLGHNLSGKYISNTNTMSLIQKTETRSVEMQNVQAEFGANISNLEDYFVYYSREEITLNNGTGFKISLQDCATLTGSQYCKDYEVATCDSGNYVNDTRTQCLECQDGYVCTNGTSQFCEPGQYIENNECHDCTVGYYCDGTNKIQCGDTEYQDATKQTLCKKCPTNLMKANDDRTACVCSIDSYYYDEGDWVQTPTTEIRKCISMPIKFSYKKVKDVNSCDSEENASGKVEYDKGTMDPSEILNPGNNKCYYDDLKLLKRDNEESVNIQVSGTPSMIDVSKLTDIVALEFFNINKEIYSTPKAKNYVVSYYIEETKQNFKTTCTFYEDCKLITMDEVKNQLGHKLSGKYIVDEMSFETRRNYSFGANIKELEDSFVEENQLTKNPFNNGKGFSINLGDCSELTDNQYCNNNKKETCGPGSYVSADRLSCNTCKEGYYCPGDDGKAYKCPNGGVANSNNTACVCPESMYYYENGKWTNEGDLEVSQSCISMPVSFVYKNVRADSCELGTGYEYLEYTPSVAQQSSLLLNPGNDKCYYSKLTVDTGLDIKAVNAASTVDISKLTDVISSWSQNPDQPMIGTTSAAKKYVVKFFVDGADSLAWEQECTFYSQCKLPTKFDLIEKLKAYLNDKYFLASDVFTLYEKGAVNTAIQLGYGENIQPYEDRFVQQNAQANIKLNTGNGFKVNLGDCSELEGNQYCNNNEKATCGPGNYVSADRLSCNRCDAGYFCLGDGTKIKCTGNQACPAGAKEYKICAPGNYVDTDSSECMQCPEDYYCSGDGSKEKCRHNQLCLPGTASPGTCPDGQVKKCSSVGWYNRCSCVSCEEGHYCKGGEKIECDAGYYCPDGASEQTKCEAGYYCPAKSSQQIECPAGAKCDGGASYSVCLGGTYQPNEGQENCLYCSSGSYTKRGAIGNTACTTCDAGYYCPDGSEKQECNKGYYCPAGAINQTQCDAGYMCPNGGMSKPTRCGVGTYQPNQAQTTCLSCDAGYYCPEGTTTLTDDLKCEAGYYCPPSATEKEQCKAGYYCPTSAEQKQCPKFFTTAGGATEKTECVISTGTAGAKFCDNNSCYTFPAGFQVHYREQ